MADLHMGLLTDRELVELVDQGLASMHARAHDTEGDLTRLAHEIDLACDRWDDVANAIPGFREDPDALRCECGHFEAEHESGYCAGCDNGGRDHLCRAYKRAVFDASSIEADPMQAQRRGL